MEAIVPTGYKKTKVGIIPTDWNLYRIDEVLKRVRNPVEVKPDEKYQEIGIRSHGKGIFYKELTTIDEIGDKSVFWIEPDCFIVNIVFAWEQAVGKTTSNEIGRIASHRFPMYKPQKDVLDLDYLVNLFKSKRGKYLLELASPGGAGRNKTLGQGEFAELQIPIPPFNEQVKIAKILTAWDEAIVKQEEFIREKEQLKKGLMQKLLSGDVRFDGFNDEWKEFKLGELFSERNKRAGEEDHELLAVTMANGVVKRDEVDIKDNSSDDKSTYKQVKINDIAYNTMRMWQGASGVSKYNGIVSPAYTIVYLKKDYDINFFGYLFKTHRVVFDFYRYSQGLTSDTWNIKYPHFREVTVKIPTSKDEQSKIVEVLKKSEEEIILLKNELSELKLQKKGLMQKLLTGQVRVKI